MLSLVCSARYKLKKKVTFSWHHRAAVPHLHICFAYGKYIPYPLAASGFKEV
jgi:hypothetical protein